MFGGGVRPGIERDVAELFVIQFQRITDLLDLSVRDAGARRHALQIRLDLRSAQIAPAPSGMGREETAHPIQAVGDMLLLRPGFPQYGYIALRPLGIRITRGHSHPDCRTHINPPFGHA